MSKKFGNQNDILTKEFNIRADIVPMVDEGDEDMLLRCDRVDDLLPVMPVMDQVLFPGVLIPVVAQREKTRRMLDAIHASGNQIAVFTQKTKAEEPTLDDLHEVGVVAHVLKVFSLRADTVVAVLQGQVRCNDLQLATTDPYLLGHVTLAPDSDEGTQSASFKQLAKRLRKQFSEVMRGHINDEELLPMLTGIASDKIFINFAASHLDIDTDEKQQLLACPGFYARAEAILKQLKNIKGMDVLSREIDEKTQEVIQKQQREYFLRHQMDVIQEELGGNGNTAPWAEDDVAELTKRAEGKQWPDEVKATFDKEIKKLSRITPMSSDYTVQYNYLETLIDLPWNNYCESRFSAREARAVMERDHYGIEKVKERIIEYLAVQQRQMESDRPVKAQVLCLVGPPGTGKTSICRSVAKALGRPCHRVALGGLHDEAEIRGHRRTYVGAMPGRILQEIIKAKVSNPVFVLDEIDKVQTTSFHGDPSSALLEVLDPEQNCHFHDNFVNIDYDLSKVLFIATANSVQDIQPALLDRMEVLDFSGYVLEEKVEIAKRHLLPRLLTDHVVDGRTFRIPDPLIELVVNEYTRESGVRQLEKQLAKIVRHRVVLLSDNEKLKATVSEDEVRQVLGLPIHNSERSQKEPREGVVTGLAWTPVGGEILFIESSLSKGKGSISMTGNLGDVMKESATLAFEYLKSNSDVFGVSQKMLGESNIHIHVPEGATPKDGPSAGITMFVAMVSAFTHRKVNPKVAMTGEITLRGDVTPVGGIKEKILAAKRAGITDLILCEDNRRDVEDIEQRYLQGLTFHYIHEMSEALPLAFVSGAQGNHRKAKAK